MTTAVLEIPQVKAVTENRWREQYAEDDRKLVGMALTERSTRLSIEWSRTGESDDESVDAPMMKSKTARPLLYFPEEIRALLDRLKPFILRICEFPDSDLDMIDVVGLRLSHGKSPGAIPRIHFMLKKQVLIENHYWAFNSPCVYLRGNEGSSLILPEGGERLVEAIRLHCLRAIDGDFPKPTQLSLMNTAEPVEETPFDE